MKIVIDISAEDFGKVKCGRGAVSMMRKAIIHGTPLPDTNVGELISRQAVIDTIETDCSWDIFNEWGSRTPTGECIINAIKSVPSVESERKTGKWIDDKCSVCGKGTEDLISSSEWYRNEDPNFCPFCGAKMEVKE